MYLRAGDASNITKLVEYNLYTFFFNAFPGVKVIDGKQPTVTANCVRLSNAKNTETAKKFQKLYCQVCLYLSIFG